MSSALLILAVVVVMIIIAGVIIFPPPTMPSHNCPKNYTKEKRETWLYSRLHSHYGMKISSGARYTIQSSLRTERAVAFRDAADAICTFESNDPALIREKLRNMADSIEEDIPQINYTGPR